MKLVTTKDIKQIWDKKNYSSIVYHIHQNDIKPVKEETVKNRFTRFYRLSDILKVKDKVRNSVK